MGMKSADFGSLGKLTDGALLAELHRVIRAHRGLTAELVAHLAEMEARKLHLQEACSSLFAYCTERLGFSEDEACRRIEAARLARRFPCIYDRLENGRVSLSVLVKFTASRTLEEKLRLARDLMSHKNPSGDLATIVEAAVDLLIAERMKRKFGQTERARKSQSAKPSRVTNATKREVALRDGLRCSFVDARGRRCSARGFLELDLEQAKARGGSSGAENVRVLCRAHNQGEAERVFGRRYMERCRKKRDFTVRDGARATYVRRRPDAMTWFAGSRSDATLVRTAAGSPIRFPEAPQRKNSELPDFQGSSRSASRFL